MAHSRRGRGPIRGRCDRARRPGRRPPTPSCSSTARICRSGCIRGKGQIVNAEWPVRDGYFETGAGTGSIVTRDKFGDVQLHVEFATPSPGKGASQDRGNSGVILMGRYEVQVLDSFENVTYADGQAASIYGEYPPLVNAARPPGEWQTYDIVFEAPKFNGTTLVAPAYVTVIWNGVLVHHRRPIMGSTSATATRARLHRRTTLSCR